MSKQPHPTPLSVRVLAPVTLAALLLAGWYALSHSGTIPATLLPPPERVVHRLWTDLISGRLSAPTGVTVMESLLGTGIGALIAIPTAWLIAHRRIAEAALSPYLAASQAVPAVALAPLLVIWIGYGLPAVVVLATIIVTFPMILSTVLGLRRVDPELLDAARVDGASGIHLARFIEWPMALPATLTGVRNGFTLSVTGAVVGELVMGGAGLGQRLAVQSQSNDTTGLFSTLIVLCALAALIYLTMTAIEWLTDPYASRQRWRVLTPLEKS